MSRNNGIELRKIELPKEPAGQHLLVAKRVLQLVQADFERVGVSPEVAQTIADPENQASIKRQALKIASPHEGVRYYGVYETGVPTMPEAMRGVIKLGPWNDGDEEPFRSRWERVTHRLFNYDSVEGRAEGLHVFAVQEGLAHMALQATWQEVVSGKSLVAAIHERDRELHDAFTALGAPRRGPTTTIPLGSSTDSYMRREIGSLDQRTPYEAFL